ncbi:MAG TPA: hypothetical protein VGR98_17120 [Streptosporangiaceae bacterium]|nr:hypothetical protein [Streptosporangiaceae bacterium]
MTDRSASPRILRFPPSTSPAPGFPANFLGSENLWTGHISPVQVSGPNLQPKGLIFVNG